jgi:hypothetical protein
LSIFRTNNTTLVPQPQASESAPRRGGVESLTNTNWLDRNKEKNSITLPEIGNNFEESLALVLSVAVQVNKLLASKMNLTTLEVMAQKELCQESISVLGRQMELAQDFSDQRSQWVTLSPLKFERLRSSKPINAPEVQ